MSGIQTDMSERINAARLLCVLCMMYVHVPNGIERELISYTFEYGRFDHWLEAFLIEGPGRAGAALLSVVSGYLIATKLLQPGASVSALYQRRFRSTLVPMLFWGVLVLAVYACVSLFRETFLDDIRGWLGLINVVFFVTDVPYGPTMHLAFLRDLFVCVLLSPLIFRVLRYAPYLLIIALGAFYVTQPDQSLFVVLRPLVLFAFTMGMFFAMRQAPVTVLDRYWPLFLAGSVFFALTIMWVNGGGLVSVKAWFEQYDISLTHNVLYPCCRLFGSLAIWTMLPLFLRLPVGRLTRQFMPYLFVAFCSHHLVLTVLFQGLWQPLLGDRQGALYIVWFVTAPVVAMIVAFLMVRAAALVAPGFAAFISGGRLDTPVRAPARASARTDFGKSTGRSSIPGAPGTPAVPGANEADPLPSGALPGRRGSPLRETGQA